MASFADGLNLIKNTGIIESIVPFLLVYAVSYGVLNRVNFIEKNELKAAIAFILAIAVIMSPTARTFITAITPGLATFAVLLFMFLLLIFSTGFKVEDLEHIIGFKENPGNILWVLPVSIGIIVILISLMGAYPDSISSNGDLIQQKATTLNLTVNEYINTLPVSQRVIYFTSLPQVIGLIILLIIFAFAGVLLVPGQPQGKK